jgi:hypothetical protein
MGFVDANAEGGGLDFDGWSKKLKSSSVKASSKVIAPLRFVAPNGLALVVRDEGMSMFMSKSISMSIFMFISKFAFMEKSMPMSMKELSLDDCLHPELLSPKRES